MERSAGVAAVPYTLAGPAIKAASCNKQEDTDACIKQTRTLLEKLPLSRRRPCDVEFTLAVPSVCKPLAPLSVDSQRATGLCVYVVGPQRGASGRNVEQDLTR